MLRWAAEERRMLPGEDQTPEDIELSSWEGAVVSSWDRQMPALFLLPRLLGTRPTGVTRELILLSPARMTEPSLSHFPFLISSCTNHLSTWFSVTDRGTQPGTHSPGLWLQYILSPPMKLSALRTLTHHSRAIGFQYHQGMDPRYLPPYEMCRSSGPWHKWHRICMTCALILPQTLRHPTSNFHTQYNTNAIWVFVTLY